MICVFSYLTIKVIFPKVWSQGYFKTADEHHPIANLIKFTQYKRLFVPLQNPFLLCGGITGECNINYINYLYKK